MVKPEDTVGYCRLTPTCGKSPGAQLGGDEARAYTKQARWGHVLMKPAQSPPQGLGRRVECDTGTRLGL